MPCRSGARFRACQVASLARGLVRPHLDCVRLRVIPRQKAYLLKLGMGLDRVTAENGKNRTLRFNFHPYMDLQRVIFRRCKILLPMEWLSQ
jgi:hypothetical protein